MISINDIKEDNLQKYVFYDRYSDIRITINIHDLLESGVPISSETGDDLDLVGVIMPTQNEITK